jgi:hypothetical protein
MAPQAIEKARFGLGNGAGSASPAAGEAHCASKDAAFGDTVADRVTALSERGYK